MVVWPTPVLVEEEDGCCVRPHCIREAALQEATADADQKVAEETTADADQQVALEASADADQKFAVSIHVIDHEPKYILPLLELQLVEVLPVGKEPEGLR